MRLFCHRWCLTARNFTHTCHLLRSIIPTLQSLQLAYGATKRRHLGLYSAAAAQDATAWQTLSDNTSRTLLYSTMRHKCALDWQSSAESIGCVFASSPPHSSPVQARVMDHLAPWAMVAAGASVIQTESNSRVLFLLRRQKHNLGKTERLEPGRPHILTATSRSRLSEGFIWLEPFLRGLCASGNTWEMKPRYLLYWHLIYLFIYFLWGRRGQGLHTN